MTITPDAWNPDTRRLIVVGGDGVAVQFDVSPVALLLLGLGFVGASAGFWWVHRRTVTDLSAGRKRLALGIRLLIVALLFLALARTRWVTRNDRLAVLFLVDASRSLRPEQKQAAQRFIEEAVKSKRSSDQFGIITFGQDPEARTLPGSAVSPVIAQHTGQTSATNIAQALNAALPLLPRGAAGKIVVLSDGNENVGSALAQVPTLTARGVRVDTFLLPSVLKRETLIEKLSLPPKVKIGEPFTVRVLLNALNPQKGLLTLRRDGQPIAPTREIDLAPGKRAVDFEVHIDRPGFFRFTASLQTDPNKDTIPENNRGEGFISVRGRPQVLYVASQPRLMDYLRRALRAQNIDVRYAPPAAMPTTAATLQPFDSILLSDVPRDAFSEAQLTAMQVCTRDLGVGFGMIGGENSFGLGGYRKTVIEEMLPVSLDLRKVQRFPPVLVALVIDRSGSMEEGGGPGKRKIDLAIEASIRAVQALKPTDRVAVITFTSDAEVQVPVTSVERAGQIISAIQNIGPGGGTSVYRGAALAFDTIKDDPTPTKHIILVTDGMSADPDYRPLVAEMKKHKVTVTGIVIGAGTRDYYANTLGYLAQETGGRFYIVDAATDIPRLYLQEIERISSRPLVEEPFTPRATPGAAEQLPGIDWSGLPLLLGYNVTELKPTADLLLLSHRNEPVLATWRYGLGRTMAFTSDDRNKWAAHWLSWSGYGQFWAQAIRWTMRSFSPSDFQTQVTIEGSRGRITVDAIDREGHFINRLAFRAKVVPPDIEGGKPLPDIPLRQTGPGRYEATFDAAQIGTYLVHITRQREDKTVESTVTGLVVPYSPEYRDLTANEFLMTQMALAGGGGLLSRPAQVFGEQRPVAYAPFDLSHWLLLLAMLLFPFDVAVRRLALQREDLARALAWARARVLLAPRPSRPGATPELSRLRAAKARALSRGGQEGEKEKGGKPSERRFPWGEEEIRPSPAPSLHRSATNAPEREPAQRSVPTPDARQLDTGGMDRLLAAKRRAQERQEKTE